MDQSTLSPPFTINTRWKKVTVMVIAFIVVCTSFAVNLNDHYIRYTSRLADKASDTWFEVRNFIIGNDTLPPIQGDSVRRKQTVSSSETTGLN